MEIWEMEYVIKWVNFFTLEGRLNEDDGIYEHVKMLDLPVDISIVDGPLGEGEIKENGYKLVSTSSQQTSRAITLAVAAIVGYSWYYKRNLSVTVIRDGAGYGFEAGSGPDDIKVRAVVQL